MKIISADNINEHYDYAFSGGGCAALSLLVHLHGAGLLAGKRVLVADRDDKRRNDRTWCFWERGTGPFEAVVHHRWSRLGFYSGDFARKLDIAPYSYKVIRGIDFYEHCRSVLADAPIDFVQGTVTAVADRGDHAVLSVAGKSVRADYLFNSLFERPETVRHWLLQHFKGWVIETPDDRFDPSEATLMDFRTGQEEGTTFVYVLPFGPRRALVEYTLFTGKLLAPAEYDSGLDAYIRGRLGISDYQVEEEEFGVIPMTDHVFPRETGRVVHLGTAGGHTKGSSGYTFRNIQKHAAAITERIRSTGSPAGTPPVSARFHFYDSVLLDVLAHRSLEGADVFRLLFRRNDPKKVLQFLDNESSLAGELRIIATLPTLPFARAALRVLKA